MATGNNYKHGYYGTPTYKSWSEMKYRCNKNVKRYKNVSYCDRWNIFINFLEDMGERPEGTSLDRINVNGNYEPSNCRWATNEQQQNNDGMDFAKFDTIFSVAEFFHV